MTEENIKKDSQELIPADEALPDNLYVLPVFSRPFFPAQIQSVMVEEDHWGETLRKANDDGHDVIGLIYAGPEEEDHIDTDLLPKFGCVVRMHNITHTDDGRIQFIAQGIRRFRVNLWLSTKRPMQAEVTYPRPDEEPESTIKPYSMSIMQSFKELIPLNPLYSEELKQFLAQFNFNQPSPLADFAAAVTNAKGEELQQILETLPLIPRMEKVLVLLKKELEIAKVQQQISQEVKEKVSEHQREFFLREQLKIIQRELGITKDDKTSDHDQFSERLSTLDLPESAQKRVDEEMKKLSMLETGSPEYSVTRNYLDWVCSVPWGVFSEDKIDLPHARKVLDKSHAGLSDVKDRILEFLAEGAFRGSVGGSIVLLAGPPGVGKTSIGRAIADSLGRKFYRFSVGGMRDEAEIKGHRRTYIGAMPGKLIQALKEVDVLNPVIMLDEIDKIGSSFQGDPASALLEVLDPEQNKEFLDHYLDIRVDLSKVLFICTANQLDTIPRPLLDRMELVRLSGYIAAEKLEISKQHLWPRLLKRTNVKKSQVSLSVSAMKKVIEGYAREAGVRNLEKQLHKVLRKSVVQLLDGEKKISITASNLDEYLGPPIFRPERLMRGVGVVTGLAWTSMGGATLPIEATLIHSKTAGLKVTGQLRDVMKESSQIAYSYVRAHAEYYGIDPDFFDTAFIHIHVPDGATPKDGPSAGVTMATALISLATDTPIKRPLAMTGELTLTGSVLAVGGIREKVIAAKRLNVKEVIMPEECQRDYDELPEQVREGMTVHFATEYDDIYDLIFAEA